MSEKSYKILLVTLVIGNWYNYQYKENFHLSHEKYAKKYGYDFKIIDKFLDNRITTMNACSFQKILVCSQEWSKNYDYIIYIDADIFINPLSPPIHLYCNFENKIGIIDEKKQIPSTDKRLDDYYKYLKNELSDIEIDDINMYLNTGVMVFQPKIHSEFLQQIFNKYIDKINSLKNMSPFTYENACIGYEIIKNNLYNIIPSKFNALWCHSKYIPETKHISLEEFFHNNYFIHFAGNCDMQYFHENKPLHKFLKN